MSKIKPINDKNMIKEIVKRGKELRPDGMFMIYNGDLCSTIKQVAIDTVGKFKTVFTDPQYIEYINNNLQGPLFNGDQLNRAVNGTKVEIRKDEHDKLISIVSTKGEWTDDFKYSDAEEAIMEDIDKIDFLVSDNDWEASISLNVEDLLNQKKFILDLSKELNVSLCKVTNKMCKNLNKKTQEVIVSITETLPWLQDGSNDINTVDDVIRICEVKVIDAISITYSYYALLDKQHLNKK